MQTADYELTFGSTKLCKNSGAVITSFQDTLPEPKVFKVDIPAGTDLDITDSLGVMGYHDGKHTFTLAVRGEDEAQVLDRVRWIVALLHGKRGDYYLSWHEGYTYNGRFKVAAKRVSPTAQVLTVTCDRYPWRKRQGDYRETVNVYAPNYLNGSTGAYSLLYQLTGSTRYHNVGVQLRQAGHVYKGWDGQTVTYDAAAGKTIATDVYGAGTMNVALDDWWLWFDGTDLKTNPAHTTTSGTDEAMDVTVNVDNDRIQIGQEHYEGEPVDITFVDYWLQLVTIRFDRWDL